MGGARPVLLKVLLFIKVGVATLKTLPRPILFNPNQTGGGSGSPPGSYSSAIFWGVEIMISPFLTFQVEVSNVP